MIRFRSTAHFAFARAILLVKGRPSAVLAYYEIASNGLSHWIPSESYPSAASAATFVSQPAAT